MSDTPTQPPANYTPTPIERLTVHTTEQRVLKTLERIEALLVQHFGSDVAQQEPTNTTKPKGRFTRK